MSLVVFLSTFNRTSTLLRTLKSMRLLNDPYELVIIDNGSDWPPAIDLLERLEEAPEVRRIFRLGQVATMNALTEHINIATQIEYQRAKKSDWFAVTDADVCFDGTHGAALAQYRKLAHKTGHAVGPHLRIDGTIPAGYPLRSRLLATETRLLYRDTMEWYGAIPYSLHPIDTTFHMFPATPTFKRLGMNTLRVGPPYDAMHLDWHVDVFNPTPENEVYVGRGGHGIGSWGRNWLAGYWNWFRESPEHAYRELLREPRNVNDDLCNASFVLAWADQYGVGVEADQERSRAYLRAAIPKRYDIFWKHEEDWVSMIYDNDFRSLGWNE